MTEQSENRLLTNLMALVAVGLTVAVLWYSGRPVETKVATMADVTGEARRGGYRLADLEAVAGLYGGEKDALFVDTRQEWEFRSGHIAGAVNFPMEPTWRARLLKRGAMEELLGGDKDRSLVFY